MTQVYMHKKHNNRIPTERMSSNASRSKSVGKVFRSCSMLVVCLNFFFVSHSKATENNEESYYSFPAELQDVLIQDNANHDNDLGSSSSQFESPSQLMAQISSHSAEAFFQAPKKKIISLLNWIEHKEAKEPPSEPYQRTKQFGRWIRYKNEGCYNTRTQVLKSFSKTPVQYRNNNPCTVESGYWSDPYSGKVFTKSSDLQIDHMVPLKDAYINGAWKWSKKERCAFANFKSTQFHLIPVDKFENMRKSDRTPADYLPPNPGYVCTYLKNWLEIKLIWNLQMSASEAEAIDKAIRDYNCDARKMRTGYLEIRQIRNLVTDTVANCSPETLN